MVIRADRNAICQKSNIAYIRLRHSIKVLDVKTYVINLDRAPERWHTTAKRLKNEGFQIERIAAVDGLKISNPEKYASTLLPRMIFGRDLSATEIACYLSHAKVWQKIIDQDIPLALILEDDAIPNPGSRTIIENMHPADVNLHLIRLHILRQKEAFSNGWLSGPAAPGIENRDIYFQTGPVWSLAAYLITKEGARILLRSSKIRWPVDCLSFSSLLHNLRHGICIPLLFSRDGDLETTMTKRKKINSIQKITSGNLLIGKFRDRIIKTIDLATLRKTYSKNNSL